RCAHHRTRHSPNQPRPVKLQPSSRARQSLEVITEEVAQQYTRRRKQLIPRARLKRAEESARRFHSSSRSPSLVPQYLPRIRSHQELTLLLTPPPDYRTDDYVIDATPRRLSRPEDYRQQQPPPDDSYRLKAPLPEVDYSKSPCEVECVPQLPPESHFKQAASPEIDYLDKSLTTEADFSKKPQTPQTDYIETPPLLDREIFKSGELPIQNIDETDCFNRRIGPPTDLIGIPLEEPFRGRPKSNGDIHTIKIEGVNSRSNDLSLPTGRVNTNTIVRSKACSLSKLNITNVIVTDCSNKEVAESFYNSVKNPIIASPHIPTYSSVKCPVITPPHISTYVINDPTDSCVAEPKYYRHTIPEETADELEEDNQDSDNTLNRTEEVSEDCYANNNTSDFEDIALNSDSELNTNEREEEKIVSCEERNAANTLNETQSQKFKHIENEPKQQAITHCKFIKKSQQTRFNSTNKAIESRKDYYFRELRNKHSETPNGTIHRRDQPKNNHYFKKDYQKRNTGNFIDNVSKDKFASKERENRNSISNIENRNSTHFAANKEEKENVQAVKTKTLRNYSVEEDRYFSCKFVNNTVLQVDKTNNKESGSDQKHKEKEVKDKVQDCNTPSQENHTETNSGVLKEKETKLHNLSIDSKNKTWTNNAVTLTPTDDKAGTGIDNNKLHGENALGKPTTDDREQKNILKEEISKSENLEEKLKTKESPIEEKSEETLQTENEKGKSTARLIYDYVRGKARRADSFKEKNENKPAENDLPKISSVRIKTDKKVLGQAKDISYLNNKDQKGKSDTIRTKNSIGNNTEKNLLAIRKEETSTTSTHPNGYYPCDKHNVESRHIEGVDVPKVTEIKQNLGIAKCKEDSNKTSSVVSAINKRKENSEKTQAVSSEGQNKDAIGISKNNSNKEDTMSRRPQVLKITDSSTTRSAPRCYRGERCDVVGYGTIRQRREENRLSAAPPLEETSNITHKMRTIFEGTPDETTKPSKNTEVQCDPVSPAKPMLIATLSVEDAGDTLGKRNQRKEVSSPTQSVNSQTLPKMKTPAFRAFSCNGQESLSSIGKTIPKYLEDSNTPRENSSLENVEAKDRDCKVAAFDGLLQYLQDYRHGLRELLVNNNVVIIEPVRQSKVRLEDQKYSARKSTSESTCRITGATIKKNTSTTTVSHASNTLPRQQKSQQPVLRRHFFYHPIKTNRELVDEELPDPDKVRHAREMFERTLKMKTPTGENFNNAVNTKCNHTNKPTKIISDVKIDNRNTNKMKRKYLTVDTVFRQNVMQKLWTDSGSLSSGVSSDLSCYDTDLESPSPRGDTFSRNSSHKEETADMFSSDDNEYADDMESKHCYLDDGYEGHYVSPEVLEKIRACGTTVTYYGGQVISASNGPVRSPMTLAIMDEIRNCKNSTKKDKGFRIIQDEYIGMKFRLVKSNSCSSRLELAGTEDEENYSHKWSNSEDINEEEYEEEVRKDDKSTDVKCEDNFETPEEKTQEEKIKTVTTEEIVEGRNTTMVENLDRVFQRAHENRFTIGGTNAFNGFCRGGPPKMCFSPEKAKLVEKGSNVLFDEMEFEEFEIAEDSLNVIEERKKSESQNNEEVPRIDHHHECHTEISEQNSETSKKINEDVQMTTWASRSVLFDFRNSDTQSSHLPLHKPTNSKGS
ncbi:hypothetical protein C0J52_19181, partial [Blattella germanica]